MLGSEIKILILSSTSTNFISVINATRLIISDASMLCKMWHFSTEVWGKKTGF